MNGDVQSVAAAAAATTTEGLSFMDSLKAFPGLVASKTASAVSTVFCALGSVAKGTLKGLKQVCAYPVALCSSHPKVAKTGLAAIALVGATYGLNKMGCVPTSCFTKSK